MLLQALQSIFLLPVIGGSVYAVLCVAAVSIFARRLRAATPAADAHWPGVSVLKPIHGLDKGLEENLRSMCTQDYPDYQVVLSVQRLDDPALPVLRRIQQELGHQRVSLVVTDSAPVVNGKVQNLSNALGAARHEILVISDSDVRVKPDYLKAIVAPLADPQVGYVCTLYHASAAERWFERLELLSYNADFTLDVIFASVSGASDFCIGSSVAFRRSILEKIGGLDALADYLVEDYELGRRILQTGKKMVLVPYFVELVVDLGSPRQWWRHQLYWDQNTRSARPWGFLATALTRALPFALLFGAVRLFDPLGLAVLGIALAVRLGAVGLMLGLLGDRDGLRSLPWLPLRDLAALVSWAVTLRSRRFVWRDLEFELAAGGRIVPRTHAQAYPQR